MRRLINRKNILIFLMAVTIFYGFYEFFVQSYACQAKTDGQDKASEVNVLIKQISNGSSGNKQSARNQLLAAKAESGWQQDPFCDQRVYQKWKSSLSREKVSGAGNNSGISTFHYSGYMEDRDHKIAIINGNEYMSGDVLDNEGYQLSAVYASKVVIEERSSHRLFEVPFQE